MEAMRLALKPFNIQHLADDWNANRQAYLLLTYLQLSVQRCQHPPAAERCCWGGGPDPPSSRALLLGGGPDPPSSRALLLEGGGSAMTLDVQGGYRAVCGRSGTHSIVVNEKLAWAKDHDLVTDHDQRERLLPLLDKFPIGSKLRLPYVFVAPPSLSHLLISFPPRRGGGRGGGRGCWVRCGACDRVFGVMLCVSSLVSNI